MLTLQLPILAWQWHTPIAQTVPSEEKKICRNRWANQGNYNGAKWKKIVTTVEPIKENIGLHPIKIRNLEFDPPFSLRIRIYISWRSANNPGIISMVMKILSIIRITEILSPLAQVFQINPLSSLCITHVINIFIHQTVLAALGLHVHKGGVYLYQKHSYAVPLALYDNPLARAFENYFLTVMNFDAHVNKTKDLENQQCPPRNCARVCCPGVFWDEFCPPISSTKTGEVSRLDLPLFRELFDVDSSLFPMCSFMKSII